MGFFCLLQFLFIYLKFFYKLKKHPKKQNKKIRNLVTKNRNKILNIILLCLSAFNDAFKLVYKTQNAKQQQYLLYYSKLKDTDNAEY